MTTILALSYVTVGALNLLSLEDSGVQWILDEKGIQGWGAPGGTLAPKPKTRQMGAWGGLSYAKQRSLVAAGVCIAPTPALASDALDRLIDACSLDDTVMAVSESGRVRWCTVRRDGDVLPTWDGDCAFGWSVQFVALDPRKFGTPLSGSTGLPSSSGGLTVPFTVPFTIASTVAYGQVSLTNPGNETGPVTMRITGPCTGPIITHVGSGLRLVFAASATIGAGEYWDIDCEAQSVLAQGQSSRANWITSRQWPGFEPGINTWSFAAASGTTSLLAVTATPADQ
jgi:hypothetical protein